MAPDTALPAGVEQQIDGLNLERDRPLIITDADEVLFAFVQELERFLDENGLFLRLDSFALTGNIRDRCTQDPISSTDVPLLLAQFFAERTEKLQPIAGAAEALAGLAPRAQIVVLSNIPRQQRPARERALSHHGMNYPIVANEGTKGRAVAHISRRQTAPVFFIDDIGRHIASVAKHADEVIRVHFIGDPRLARLADTAPEAHVRIDAWPAARAYIEARLAELGY